MKSCCSTTSHDQLPRLASRCASIRWILASASAAVRSLTRWSRSAWVRRRLSSVRRRIATSALSARLGTETLIMKVSSSRKDSLRPISPNGPACSIVRPDRKAGQDQADRRGVARPAPQRRPDQRQDRQEAERAGIFGARQQRAEGDQAHRDGAAEHRAAACSVAAVECAPVRLRPQHDHRRHHQRAGGIAQPPGDPDRGEIRPSGETRHAQRHHADGGADDGRRPDADESEFRHPRRAREGLAAARPAFDQKAADHAFQRIAEGDDGGGLQVFRRWWHWRRRRR